MRNSAKNKIYFGIFGWLVLCFVMFGFVFKRLDASNQAALDVVSALKKEQATLEAEKQSFEQAQNDLKKLASEEIQPENFFSRDVTLVNEIRRLESIGRDLNMNLALAGVSGTLKTLRRAGTKSEVFQIPFIISTQGSLTNTVMFMEYLENLEFLTSVNAASISSVGTEGVSATFNASFYLKK